MSAPTTMSQNSKVTDADPPHAMNKPRPRVCAAVLLAIFALLVCARLPFIDNILMGEEGMFAYMAVDNGDGGKLNAQTALLIGRVEGQNHWDAPRHPILPYYVLVDGIRPLNSTKDFIKMQLAEKTRVARRPFLFMFLVAMALPFYLSWWIVSARRQRVLTISLLLFWSCMPLLVGGSIQPQLDGSWGVLLCAIVVVLLFSAARASGGKAQLLGFASGFAAALGKNEWWLSLLGATVAGFAMLQIVRRVTGTQSGTGRIAVGLILGILAGSAFSWWLDPSDFMGGFEVMGRFAAARPSAWEDVFAMRWPWIWPVVVLFTIACVVTVCASELLSTNPFKLVVFFWGMALLCGFFLTSWSGDGFPRYFCPAAVVLLCFLVDAFRTVRVPRLLEITLVCLLLTGTVKNIATLRNSYRREISISSLPGAAMSQAANRYMDNYERFVTSGGAAITDAAYGYYFPTTDFAVQSMGAEQAREALEQWKTTK